MDAPYNLVPSLHAALLLLLVDLYARNLRKLLRWTVMAWFGPRRTFAAADLSASCHRHRWRLRPRRILLLFLSKAGRATRRYKNPRIGVYYAATALILIRGDDIFCGRRARCCSGRSSQSSSYSLAYFGLGRGIFRKTSDDTLERPLRARTMPGRSISLAYLL